jgi:nucleoside-diphosphate-sugar epimerase
LSGVRQVLITGTCFEYGFQSGPIASTATPSPNNPYAVAKDSLRQQLEFLSKEHSFTFQWTRLFYMYGKGQNPKSVLSQLDTAIENKDATFNMSGGEQLRDYLPIEAVAQQLLDLFESSRGGTFNICSGNPISVRRLVEEQINKLGSTIKPNLGYYPYPDYEPMSFWGVRDITD